MAAASLAVKPNLNTFRGLEQAVQEHLQSYPREERAKYKISDGLDLISALKSRYCYDIFFDHVNQRSLCLSGWHGSHFHEYCDIMICATDNHYVIEGYENRKDVARYVYQDEKYIIPIQSSQYGLSNSRSYHKIHVFMRHDDVKSRQTIERFFAECFTQRPEMDFTKLQKA